MSNTPSDERARIHGEGSFKLPEGITADEARQLAEQADNERNQ